MKLLADDSWKEKQTTSLCAAALEWICKILYYREECGLPLKNVTEWFDFAHSDYTNAFLFRNHVLLLLSYNCREQMYSQVALSFV